MPRLVLGRNIGEAILIGNDIRVQIDRGPNGAIRLVVEAPTHIKVLREEIKDKPAKS